MGTARNDKAMTKENLFYSKIVPKKVRRQKLDSSDDQHNEYGPSQNMEKKSRWNYEEKEDRR